MLELATPMHKEMYPDHGDHSDLSGRERENKIIGEVLSKIADDHVQRDQLLQHVKDDLAGITQFIRDSKLKVQAQIQEEKIRVTGKSRDDLQAVIASVRAHDFGLALSFNNFRD